MNSINIELISNLKLNEGKLLLGNYTSKAKFIWDDRNLVIDWIIALCEEINNDNLDIRGYNPIENYIYFLSVSILDRYLSNNIETDKNKLQEIAISCLYISIKYYMKSFEFIEFDFLKFNKIWDIEQKILSNLTYDIYIPTCYDYIYQYGIFKSNIADMYKGLIEYNIFTLLFNKIITQYPQSCISAAYIYWMLSVINLAYDESFKWNKKLKGLNESLENITGYSLQIIHNLSMTIGKEFIFYIKSKYLSNKYIKPEYLDKLHIDNGLYFFNISDNHTVKNVTDIFIKTYNNLVYDKDKYFFNNGNTPMIEKTYKTLNYSNNYNPSNYKINKIICKYDSALSKKFIYRVNNKLFNNDIKILKKIENCTDCGMSDSNLREVIFCKYLKHDNIINCHAIDYNYKNKSSITTLLLESMNETLFDIIKLGKINNQNIKMYSKQILEGLKYCHNNGIIHCDLKPDNIMINNNNIKIIDFNLSISYNCNINTYYNMQAFYYRSPEIFMLELIYYKIDNRLFYNNIYFDSKIDIWSFGCILFEMYYRTYFLYNSHYNNIKDIIHNVNNISNDKNSKYYINHSNLLLNIEKYDINGTNPIGLNNHMSIVDKDKYDNMDPLYLDCLSNILVYNFYKRPSADDLLKHKYFL